MNALRARVVAIGLASIASIPYERLSQNETFRLVSQRANNITYETFNKKVIEYPGASIVLFTISCPRTFEKKIEEDGKVDYLNPMILTRNMESVYLNLIDKFEKVTVNNRPINFSVLDMCGGSKAISLLQVRTIETHMYLNGREIDRRRGSPTMTENSLLACSAWIQSNLLDQPYYEDDGSGPFRVVYRGKHYTELVPFSPLRP